MTKSPEERSMELIKCGDLRHLESIKRFNRLCNSMQQPQLKFNLPKPEWQEDKLIHPLLHCKGHIVWDEGD